jgi:hypothetical protein
MRTFNSTFGSCFVQHGTKLNPFTRELTIGNVATPTSDFLMPLILHRGANTNGIETGRDVYFDNKCLADFSDVEFSVEGVPLKRYIANVGHDETVYDSTLLYQSFIIDSNTVVGNQYDAKAYISRDAGKTYSIIYNSICGFVFVDSRGYFYVSAGYILRRSIDQGANWVSVLDMTAQSGDINKQTITEDAAGNLFIGRYQLAYNPIILKSTDGGANWVDVLSTNTLPVRPRNAAVALRTYCRPATANGHIYYCSTAGTTADNTGPTWPTTLSATVTDGTVVWKESALQHVHNVTVDKYTGAIYAAFDGEGTIFKSTDGGVTWIWLYTADSRAIICGDGYRLFGAGAYQIQSSKTIIKTVDDINFYPVMHNMHSVQDMVQDADGAIYAGVVAYANGKYPTLYKSINDGDTWISVWIGDYLSASGFRGPMCLSNIGILDGVKQSIVGVTAEYSNCRLIVGDSGKSQAIAYVGVPTIADGLVVSLKTNIQTASDLTVFKNTTDPNPLIRVKFDEGIGNPADTSSAPFTLFLTQGAGGWEDGGRFAGQVLPKITTLNKSYKFSGNTHIKVLGTENMLNRNYTAVCWFKCSVIDAEYRTLFGNWGGSRGVQLTIRNGIYYLYYNSLTISNGTDIRVCDGEWHMAGVIIDNSNPEKIKIIHDGVPLNYNDTWSSLAAAILDSTTMFKIGAGGINTIGAFFNGNISDLQVYNGVLTALQIRAIYENRPLLATEPTISV